MKYYTVIIETQEMNYYHLININSNQSFSFFFFVNFKILKKTNLGSY